MFGFTTEEIVTALISALFIGFSKTTGTSLGTAIIPFFTMVFEAKIATGILTISFLLASIQSFKINFKSIKFNHFKILFPWAMLGFIFGGFLLVYLNDNTLKICISLIIFSILLISSGNLLKFSFFEKIGKTANFDRGCGILIGVTSIIANAASPIMAIYLLAKGETKFSFIATQVAFFLLIDIIKIPFYLTYGIITPSSLGINLIMLPCMVIGGTLGVLFLKWIPENKFKTLIYITSMASAVKLGFSAI